MMSNDLERRVKMFIGLDVFFSYLNLSKEQVQTLIIILNDYLEMQTFIKQDNNDGQK